MSAIVAEGLVKIYRSRKSEVRALDGLDLTVAEGTVLGLLGPNGAGKTTTVRILATLLRPDSGRATVGGLDVVHQAQQIRRLIGLSGQYAAVDENLTGRENLWLFGRLYQLPSAEARRRANAIAVVDHGRIIARGTSDELKAQVGGERIEVVVHTRDDIARAIVVLTAGMDGDHTIDEHMRKITVPARGGAQRLAHVVRELDDAQIGIDDIALRRPTLDDVFLSLTGHAAEVAAASGASDGR